MRKGNPGVFSTLKNLIDVQEDALILTYKGMIGVRKLSVSQMNNLIQSAILSKNPLVLTNLLHVLEHFPPESIYPLYNLAEEKHLYGMGDILYDHPIFGPAIENEFGKDIKHKIEAIKTNAIKSRYTGQKINLSEINQLIELNLESKFLWYFYCDFYEKCLELKGSLTKDKIDKMYYAFIEVLYNLKLDLYDSQQGAYHQKLTLVRPIPFEGKNRVIWTPEQEAASLVFIEKTKQNIFSFC